MTSQLETAVSVAKPGLEWWGNRPALWSHRKLGYLVSTEGGCTPSKANPTYWTGDIPWVSPKDMKAKVISDSEDHVTDDALRDSNLRLIEPPVVLIVVRGMILAHSFPVAITAVPVTVNQDMKALRPRPGCLTEYLAYLLGGIRSTVLSLVDDSAHGTKCLRTEVWKNIDVAIPPIEQQQAIVQFLDRETARIDALIGKKKRQIELLHEKRTALISHAVTKGLDLDAPMKDSGIEWLGKVPEHWPVVELRRVASDIQTGPFGSQLHASDYVDGGVPIVNPANIEDGRIVPDQRTTIDEDTFARLRCHALKVGDIVFGRRGEMGRCALIGEAEQGFLCGTGSIRARLRAGVVHPGFLALFLRHPGIHDHLLLESVGSTMNNLNTTIIGRIPVALPPLQEQLDIEKQIRQDQGQVDDLVETIDLSIKRLREYRAALISAAVTGKIDVRQEVA